MSAFLACRAVFIVLFALTNLSIAVFAGLTMYGANWGEEPLPPIDVYLIVLSVASFFFVTWINVRQGTIMSMVWYECLWMAIACILNIAGASAVTSTANSDYCTSIICPLLTVLIFLTWLLCALVLPQLILTMVLTVRYQKSRPHIWTANVREVRWFNGGGWPEDDAEKATGRESPALTKMEEAAAEKRGSSDSILSLPPRYSFATSIASWNPSESGYPQQLVPPTR